MHGQVTHVASHQSVGFTDLERMLEFIREQLARQEAGHPEPSGAAVDGEAPGDGPGAGGPA
jgi:hypothetical protein